MEPSLSSASSGRPHSSANEKRHELSHVGADSSTHLGCSDQATLGVAAQTDGNHPARASSHVHPGSCPSSPQGPRWRQNPSSSPSAGHAVARCRSTMVKKLHGKFWGHSLGNTAPTMQGNGLLAFGVVPEVWSRRRSSSKGAKG